MMLSRRRAIAVMAAAMLSGSAQVQRRSSVGFHALGAVASITLIGDPAQARAALDACRAEIAAIERVFSLWDPASEISRLNADGALDRPDARLVELAGHAAAMSDATGGAFDVTVQTLWAALARDQALESVLHLLDWSAMEARAARIAFRRPGMAATFNGIAQGYAADRVARVLRGHGFHAALIDLGEFRALGNAAGRPWRIGVHDPLQDRIATTFDLGSAAVATSEPGGTLIAGRPHIFDPLHRGGPRWRSVTVVAGQAWRADALSTAIAASPTVLADDLLRAGGAMEAVLIGPDGALRRWRA